MSRSDYSHNARQASKPVGLRLLVCGDRNWIDYGLINHVLREIHAKTPIECVIEGDCRGADLLARAAAENLGIRVLPFPANWTKYGGAAGPIRNQQMIDIGKPDKVIAFHDHLMLSVGTADMVRKALDTIGEVTLIGHVGICGPGGHSEQILRRQGFPL